MWKVLGETQLNSESVQPLEKEERKSQVWNLILHGYNQQQIADKFGVSLKTISRDCQELKKGSAEWMETLPKGQIQMYHKSNFEIIEQVTRELWKLYEETEDEKLKLKILNTIAEKRRLIQDMMNPSKLLRVRNQLHEELAPRSAFEPLNFDNERKKIDYEKL